MCTDGKPCFGGATPERAVSEAKAAEVRDKLLTIAKEAEALYPETPLLSVAVQLMLERGLKRAQVLDLVLRAVDVMSEPRTVELHVFHRDAEGLPIDGGGGLPRVLADAVSELFGGISASLRRECKGCGVVGYATQEHYDRGGGLCPECLRGQSSPEQPQTVFKS